MIDPKVYQQQGQLTCLHGIGIFTAKSLRLHRPKAKFQVQIKSKVQAQTGLKIQGPNEAQAQGSEYSCNCNSTCGSGSDSCFQSAKCPPPNLHSNNLYLPIWVYKY